MKSHHQLRVLLTAVSFGGSIAFVCSAAFADGGRGSIRAAGRPEAAPRAAAARPEPARPEPAHAEPARPEAARPEPPRAAPEVRRDAPHEPPPRPDVQAHRDWDDHDEDTRHFGGFAPGSPIHIVIGQRFHDLPPRHFDIPWHDHHYFFDPTGVFYELGTDGQYVSIQPPIGIPITALPDGADAISLGPTTYYYLDGDFYIAQGDGFVVVAPPSGIVVPTLPDGATQVVLNGAVVYQFNGFNYTPSLLDGVTQYTVTPA